LPPHFVAHHYRPAATALCSSGMSPGSRDTGNGRIGDRVSDARRRVLGNIIQMGARWLLVEDTEALTVVMVDEIAATGPGWVRLCVERAELEERLDRPRIEEIIQ
jgi:hypothetical protein